MWYHPKVLFKLGGLSMFSFALNLGITTGLTELFLWEPRNSYTVALLVVLMVNFVVMRYKIFRGAGGAWRQIGSFLLISVASRGMERASFAFLHGVLALQYQLCVVLISCVFTVLKYAAYGIWVFKGPSPEGKTETRRRGSLRPNTAEGVAAGERNLGS